MHLFLYDIKQFLKRKFPSKTVYEAMKDFDNPVSFVGSFSNKRKIAQNGCFLIFGKDTTPFENNPKSQDCLAYISVKNKKYIRRQLNQMFINSFSVYPDFCGAKKQLELYGSLFRY